RVPSNEPRLIPSVNVTWWQKGQAAPPSRVVPSARPLSRPVATPKTRSFPFFVIVTATRLPLLLQISKLRSNGISARQAGLEHGIVRAQRYVTTGFPPLPTG